MTQTTEAETLQTIRDSAKDLKRSVDMGLPINWPVLLDLIEETCDEALGSPSGGMVDTRVSNTLAARRPGSNPGTGTNF